MRAIVLLVALAISAGAARAQSRQANRPPNPEMACVEAVAHRTDLAPIAGKIWLGSAPTQPAALFVLTDKASESDKPLIATWGNSRWECSRQGQAWARRYAPSRLVALANKSNSSFFALTADLYAGKITYGDYAKARAKLFADGEQKADAAAQHLK